MYRKRNCTCFQLDICTCGELCTNDICDLTPYLKYRKRTVLIRYQYLFSVLTSVHVVNCAQMASVTCPRAAPPVSSRLQFSCTTASWQELLLVLRRWPISRHTKFTKFNGRTLKRPVLRIRIRDPVLFLTPGSRIRGKFFSGSQISDPTHISERLIFWFKPT